MAVVKMPRKYRFPFRAKKKRDTRLAGFTKGTAPAAVPDGTYPEAQESEFLPTPINAGAGQKTQHRDDNKPGCA